MLWYEKEYDSVTVKRTFLDGLFAFTVTPWMWSVECGRMVLDWDTTQKEDQRLLDAVRKIVEKADAKQQEN